VDPGHASDGGALKELGNAMDVHRQSWGSLKGHEGRGGGREWGLQGLQGEWGAFSLKGPGQYRRVSGKRLRLIARPSVMTQSSV